jgi:hypothetical protein
MENEPMNVKSLREAKNHQPFQPFVVTFADGRRFEIPHPDFLSINPSGRDAVVYRKGGSWSIVEPLLILSLDYAGPPGSNGPSAPPV